MGIAAILAMHENQMGLKNSWVKIKEKPGIFSKALIASALAATHSPISVGTDGRFTERVRGF